MRLELLVEATNRLLRLEEPSAEELLAMAVSSCRELRMLHDDPAFFDALRFPAAQSEAVRADIAATLGDLNRFAGFLAVEQELLLQAGVETGAARALLGQAGKLRPFLAAGAMPDAEALRVALNGLANEVCQLADRLKNDAALPRFRRSARPVLRRVALVLGGAAVVGVNLAVAARLQPVYAGASVSVGGGMIKDGLFGE